MVGMPLLRVSDTYLTLWNAFIVEPARLLVNCASIGTLHTSL